VSIFAFGEFRLDAGSGRLTRHGEAITLAPKAFALLQFLAEHPGRLIPKRELLSAIWPDVHVGDAVLKNAIRDVRKALGDSPAAPRFIETAHRRGYRFVAATPVSVPSAPAPVPAASAPRVHYARSGDANIAYQVVGSGPIDLVFVMGWVSHLEYFWNEPSFARFLTRLASRARLILFDKRGTGLSDPVPISQLPSLEQRLDDVRAVMDAVGSERAVLFGVSEGGPLCSLFAATYPEKTEALVMIGSYARRLRADDYPWGSTREDRDRFCTTILEHWGGPVGVEERAPSMASDPAFRDWWAAYLRMGASPGAAVALTRMNADIDVRDVLPSIRVPALVLHRTGDRCLSVNEGRYLASRIPGATFVELPGDDHLPFAGDQDALFAALEPFLARMHDRTQGDGVLATVVTLMADGPAADLDRLGLEFSKQVVFFRGHVCADGEGTRVAAFDGPGRAVHLALALLTHAAQHGVEARAGVHIGQYDRATGGPVIVRSAALARAAGPHRVLVSRTVVDLLPGSGLAFEVCQGHGDLHAFAVVPSQAVSNKPPAGRNLL
jgi:pimeloyl-ACP methyl ester carboxylesterase/DNA-binding winged helix-turn-helix (wHTH) protein